MTHVHNIQNLHYTLCLKAATGADYLFVTQHVFSIITTDIATQYTLLFRPSIAFPKRSDINQGSLLFTVKLRSEKFLCFHLMT